MRRATMKEVSPFPFPQALSKLMGSKNPKKSAAVMQAMLQLVKIDVAKLRRAHHEA